MLLIADGAYAVVRLGISLRQTGDHFQAALAAFERARFTAARGELQAALESARSAGGYARHPGTIGASLAPVVGNDTDALRSISDASQLAARAGLEGVRAASDLGITATGLPAAIYRHGRVRFGSVRETAPIVDHVDRLLHSASVELQGAPDPRFSLVAQALATAQDRISGVGESAHKANVLFRALPRLLAQDGTRRYLLLFQALGEARGTGGLAGIWGVLQAREGRLRLLDIAPIAELQPEPISAVDAPAWFERGYGPLFALRQWSQANLSPSFPAVSKVFLQMYEQARGPRLDGVIALDPVALEELIPATGPLRHPGLDVGVGAGNASEVLMRDAYTDTGGPAAQNRYLEGLVRQFWDRIYQGDVDPLALARGLGSSVTSQHLKAYATSGQDQTSLHELGADGDFTSAGPNVQMVFHNNVGANKVDYFLRRSIQSTVQLNESGSARVTTTISLENKTPFNLTDTFGSGIGNDPAGLNRMYLNVLMPQGATLQSFSLNGRSREPFRLREQLFPVAWDILEIPAGRSAQAHVTYTIPRAVDLSAGTGSFEMTLWPQTSAAFDQYSLDINLPGGYSTTEIEGIDIVRSGLLQASGPLDRPTTVAFRLID